jgi:AcrR family transcriptional regulator
MMTGAPASRAERRRAQTRRALVQAAQRLFAQQGSMDASIQQITDAADVGLGTFYNHFTTKTDLFDAAVEDALEQHGAWLDDLLAEVEDPAEVFATSMRLTGRLLRISPQLARVVMHSTSRLMRAPVGLAPRALRDIRKAADAGRFEVGDAEVALACAAGALSAVLQLLDGAAEPARIDQATDLMVHNVLRMFGMSDAEATRLVELELPVTTPPVVI